MRRDVTNVIRFFMDECLPPLIRDNKYFMYPFFQYAFKGKHVKKMMEFKSYAHKLTDADYEQIYRELEAIGNDRPTDLNQASVEYILANIPEGTQKVLDVGCGRGYFVKKLVEKGYDTYGCDVFTEFDVQGVKYFQGNIESLPFADNEFDVVTCSHTLEHVKDLKKAIAELKRVAKDRIIITVPKQRYYYYTLDLHLHFFPYAAKLEEVMDMEKFTLKKIWGDWVYIGYLR